MQLKNLGVINPEQVSEEEANGYQIREAARAIVLDSENKIAILNVSNKHYYKLPGGGIEAGEDKIAAMRRECLEEIGCDVDVLAEVGMITEYRKMFSRKQISYCYFARVKGEKGIPKLEQGEIDDGFKEVWLTYDEILRAMRESAATTPEGKHYIVPRDTLFITEARGHLDSLT